MTRRSWIAIIGVAALGPLTLAGCGDSSAQDQSGSQNQAAPQKQPGRITGRDDPQSYLGKAARKAEVTVEELQERQAGLMDQIEETEGRVEQTVQDQREAFVRKAQEKVDQLESQIAKLKDEAAQVTGDAAQRIRERIDLSEARLETARERLDEVKDAGENAWSDLKAGLGSALGQVELAIASARERLEESSE